jgi:hypothetical protein
MTEPERDLLLHKTAKTLDALVAALLASTTIDQNGLNGAIQRVNAGFSLMNPEPGREDLQPPAPPKPTMPYPNSREAFWATQPPEVRALRNIPETLDRYAAAIKLASAGFLINRQIHVSDFDPAPKMREWIQDGYGAWAPGILIADLYVNPSFSGNPARFGQKHWDSLNPPPGSFPIDLKFAEGYVY